MSTTACQFFYQCENCSQLLKPKEGDCCFIVLMVLLPVHPFRKETIAAKNEKRTLYRARQFFLNFRSRLIFPRN